MLKSIGKESISNEILIKFHPVLIC